MLKHLSVVQPCLPRRHHAHVGNVNRIWACAPVHADKPHTARTISVAWKVVSFLWYGGLHARGHSWSTYYAEGGESKFVLSIAGRQCMYIISQTTVDVPIRWNCGFLCGFRKKLVLSRETEAKPITSSTSFLIRPKRYKWCKQVKFCFGVKLS